jgi:predicted aspartyl protease
MSPTRRAAIAGLLGSAAGACASSAWGQAVPVLEQPAVPDEAPTRIDTGHDLNEHMMAPVGINGQGPFQFLIDTGANTSCVSTALADRLALTPGDRTRVHTMAGVSERPSVLINRLDVGDRSRRKVVAPSFPIQGDGVDGVLGVDWLKGQRLVLGFKTRTLEITRSRDEPGASDRVIVPARRRFGQLTIIDADLNGERISGMIDSGSQVSVCNRPLRDLVMAAEARRGPGATHRSIGLETLAGEHFTAEELYLPFLRLGGLRLGNVPIVYAESHVFDLWGLKETPAVILGMDLLTQFDAVSLDFGRSKVRFDLSKIQAAGRA